MIKYAKIILDEIMQTNEMTTIKDQVRGLPTEQKVELIKFLADTLSAKNDESIPLQFGKYSGSDHAMATEADFEIAEWNPTELELNGN